MQTGFGSLAKQASEGSSLKEKGQAASRRKTLQGTPPAPHLFAKSVGYTGIKSQGTLPKIMIATFAECLIITSNAIRYVRVQMRLKKEWWRN